jgi:hypothetical protein
MSLLRFLCSRSPSEEYRGSCNGATNLHRYRAIHGNSPFNGLLYAELEVIALYSREHKGNYVPTERIGSHFDKVSTPLTINVHFYRTEIEMSVNCLKENPHSPSKQMVGFR